MEPVQSESSKPASHGRRRFFIGLNTSTAILLAAALLGMVNYLSYRYYLRADWSRSQYYALSDKTLQLLAGLTNTIQVVSFISEDSSDIYEDVMSMLREYEEASDRIRVERINPHRDMARTKELAARYDVKEMNVVVFDNGGRSKYVRENEIMEMDYSPMAYGQEATKSSFKGEQAFSSAILGVTQLRKPVVYFVKGHGERDIENFDPYNGFSELAKEIRRDNVDLKPITLGDSPAVPADCDALVIAGPAKKFSQPEVDIVRRYLEKEGRLLLLLDARTQTGLDAVLEDWGIRVAEDVVIDSRRTITGRELLITEYGPHAITRHLNDLVSLLYLPRSVSARSEPEEKTKSADQPRVTALASSSESGWAETDFEQNPMKYDPETDQPGPVSVAVAVERGGGNGIDVDIRPTRLVVFGDSDFLSNGGMSGGNLDFALNAMNWLLEREDLMAIAPKPVEQIRLVMSGSQLKLLLWMVVVILPGLVGILGLVVWMRRRS